MVDANGNIVKVSESNLTLTDSQTGYRLHNNDEHNLFRSLQFAGSSFGIVTEFHYRIFSGAELLPIFALVYIDNEHDLKNYQNAALDGKYSLTLYFSYFFTPLDVFSRELLGPNLFRMIFKA